MTGNSWESFIKGTVYNKALTNTAKLASTGNMYCYPGSMMCNSPEPLLAHKIARENKRREDQDKKDEEEEKEIALFEKTNQACLIFKEGGLLLSKLDKTRLQDTVRFLCSVEKRKEDTYSKHSRSNNQTRERITKVQPVWTKHFAPSIEEEEEPTVHSTSTE